MELLSISFNQDSSALAVGARKTFNLFNLPTTDDVNKMLPENVLCTEDVVIVERLFSSSLITYVTAQNPRRLQVCHYQKQQEICHQMYPQKILSVRLNRTRLVVCLEESLFIHNIKDMKILHTIKDTPPNMLGVADLCPNDISYLAYPGSLQIGEVQVYDACNLQAVVTIQAHSSRIAALKFNEEGTKLATASEKGTVIKVFLASKGMKLFEFRRGMKRNATIHSMGFSPDSLFLCCSSSTETVHVFKLDPKEERKIVEEGASPITDHQQQQAHSTPPDDQFTGVQGKMKFLLFRDSACNRVAEHRRVNVVIIDDCLITPLLVGKVAIFRFFAAWFSYVGKTAASYMPAAMSDVFQQDRAFAQARLPQSGFKNVGALSYHRQKLRLIVASLDGYLYLFDFNKDEGGDCQLVKSHRLVVTYPQASASINNG
uniref:WD repeat domain phosphoinositide-interacting protein 2 n=1 Tax=Romanomermis culicivorax TaxID=13658 RepID=A0A915L007_ROMCU